MLNTVYRDAITRRDQILAQIRGPKHDTIVGQAKQNWIPYEPTKQSGDKTTIAGIDSSFNTIKFQGLDLGITTAVSVLDTGDVIADLHDTGFGSHLDLSAKSRQMEIKACKQTVDWLCANNNNNDGLILMDGSLYSQFMFQTTPPPQEADMILETIQNNNVLFVSKNSNTQKQFGSIAGDIFYYNQTTKGPGFSKPFAEKIYYNNTVITSTFVRLADSTPLIKLELLGSGHSDTEIKSILSQLYQNSVGGYPHALKLAHNNCKVSVDNMNKMASVLGLHNEVGSREVLE